MVDSTRYQDAIKHLRLAAATGGSCTINRDGRAVLHRVVINSGVAQTLTIVDGPLSTDTKVAVIELDAVGTLEYGLPLKTGLTVILSGTADVTVVYE